MIQRSELFRIVKQRPGKVKGRGRQIEILLDKHTGLVAAGNWHEPKEPETVGKNDLRNKDN